ncbi:YicC family protein [Phenylobacterium sp. J426]|uniref:YicC/YloC family endoribonuclease n=1 Tax=Phenylobacterium sp. J426 TaxID=2898439 RepID=UPI002150AACA|nr:YicC/YloC family endoribonuclease [Phenylobacterium sp. J426]MCR5875824.1 YicC family protein [Phenylobacterium sp. J426]
MAISGMTGFGRAEGALGGWTWAAEARSVNGRNLEVRFRGPPGFDSLERAARDGAQGRFQRGQVTVGVQAKRSEAGAAVRINLDQLERYLEASRPLVDAGRASPPSMDGLLALRGVIEADDGEQDPDAMAALEAAMAASIGVALGELLAARRQEGAQLLPVLGGQLDRIAELIAQAGSQAAEQPVTIKARFEARMKELAGDAASEDRIVQEAAALAVKADVREELDRLAGHVEAARGLLATDGAVGRRLDFLTQEFMREANTLCSKSALSALTGTGLELKATIEQFREQVQNVE